MAKPSGFMKQMELEKRQLMRAARQLEHVFCCDMICIALGRMGYGEKRLNEVDKVFGEAYRDYDRFREEDGREDNDAWYFKSKLDEELRRYRGADFPSYEERYYNKKG